MERTESVVVQVAPSYENTKIQEMERFGWNLQSRQELHEEGDAEGGPSVFGDKYVIKTKVSHYTKLHFARPSSIPNLDRIRQIEAEYSKLPFPNGPSLKWPIGLTAFFLFGLFADPTNPISFIFVALCGFWIFRRVQKRNSARSTCESSLAKRRKLLEQLAALE